MHQAPETSPRISVITPSYNQGAYLRETLGSIVGQGYSDLELIVMDGGSSDDSVAVIESFADHIAYWESERDEGQAHAINKGFERSTGEILCWLNSDDLFREGALEKVASHFMANPDCNWLTAPTVRFGAGVHEPIMRYRIPHNRLEWLVRCPISQPSTFWRRGLYERFGGLDESYHYALDYEYWVRFVFGGEKPDFIDRSLSKFRLHEVSKTVSQSEGFAKEEDWLREKYRTQLSAAEWKRLEREIARTVEYDALAAGVALLKSGTQQEAKREVKRILKGDPSLLFTRTGAASLFRVLMNKPREERVG